MSNSFGVRWAVLLAMVLAPAGEAFAWNNAGHMTVALLAYHRLTAAQQRAADELLKHHPHYELSLAADRPEFVPLNEWVFARAATWPDFVRPDKDRRKPEDVTQYHNGPWHYVNLPFIPAAAAGRVPADRFRPAEVNILTALRECKSVLQSTTAGAEQKAIHLAWLLHLVGDIHQPMHCVSLVSEQYPQGDQGGNLVGIRPHDVPMRLHAFWDDVFSTDSRFTSVSKQVQSVAAETGRDPLLAKLLAEQRFDAWAAEGLALAKSTAYLNGELPMFDWSRWEQGALSKDAIRQLSPEYQARARELARKRIGLAGMRLSEQLKEALR